MSTSYYNIKLPFSSVQIDDDEEMRYPCAGPAVRQHIRH